MKRQPIELKVGNRIVGEDAFKAELRRAGEIALLKAQLPGPSLPERVGKRRISENEARIFRLAVDAANGADTGEFLKLCAIASAKAHARTFEIVAAGMHAAKDARGDVLGVEQAHVIAALAAKLELERHLDRLPDTMEHSRRASKIALAWFRNQDFATYEQGHKAWSKVRRKAGLDYLPKAKRGKGRRK